MRLTSRVERLEARAAGLEDYRLARRIGEHYDLDPHELLNGADDLAQRMRCLEVLGMTADEALVAVARERNGLDIDPTELRAKAKARLEAVGEPCD
ncbi:MAG: hypothetical protein WBD55_06265 [Dehalococcoidia bacterium]